MVCQNVGKSLKGGFDMACYDCEECSKNISNGGNCNRFEYNCPFLAVEKYNTEKIVKLRNKIKMIFLRMKSV